MKNNKLFDNAKNNGFAFAESPKEAKKIIDKEKETIKEIGSLFTVELNSDLISGQNKTANDLIKVNCDIFYQMVMDIIFEITKELKKIDLNDPKKRSINAKLFGIGVKLDDSLPENKLYNCLSALKDMSLQEKLEELINKIEKVQEEHQANIDENANKEISLISKATFLTHQKAIEQSKISLIQAQNCLDLILDNYDIQKFYYYWTEYRENGIYPSKNPINDNAIFLAEYINFLSTGTVQEENGKINYIDLYNDIMRRINRIANSNYDENIIDIETSFLSFYKDCKTIKRITDKIEQVDLLIEKKVREATDEKHVNKYKHQLNAIKQVESEYQKMESLLDNLLDDKSKNDQKKR